METKSFEKFAGPGVDTSVFTPLARSSKGTLRCCCGGDKSPTDIRWYGIYYPDGTKVSPTKVAFCEWCGEHAFKASEVWQVPSGSQHLGDFKCSTAFTPKYLDIVGNRRCVLREFALPDGSIQNLQLNCNLINRDDTVWVPITVGAGAEDKAAANSGVLRANVPTHSYWEVVIGGYKGDVISNDDGVRTKFGQMRRHTHKLYCGRSAQNGEIDWPNGSDGQCGPNDGPQCASCIRLQEKQPWFKVISAKFKNGESVSITNSSGNSNFYTPLAGGQLIINSKATGVKGKRFFSVTPPRSAVRARQEGNPLPDDSTAHMVAEHDTTSNILEIEISLHIEKKPQPKPVYREGAYFGGGFRSGGDSGVAKGGGFRSGGIARGRSKKEGLTGGSNFSASGHSEHVHTTTTISTFPEIGRVKYTVQLVNDEGDDERMHFANIIDQQIVGWKTAEIAQLTRQRDQIDAQIGRLQGHERHITHADFDQQALHLV